MTNFALTKRIVLGMLLGLLSFLVIPSDGFAHPKPKHKPNQADSTLTAGEKPTPIAGHIAADQPMAPPIDEIPTAHSAVVHFPLVFLLVAALFQLIAVFRPRKGLHWQVAGLALGGFIGAYAASSFAHPHTHGLSQSAQQVLEHHEQLAQYTLWLAGSALLLKAITLWRSYRWMEAITALVLISSVYFVMHASHMGGELLYRYGVGPRGAYLEQHHHIGESNNEADQHEHTHSAH